MDDLFRGIEFKVQSPKFEKSTKKGKRIIRGYASTDALDRQNEIISREALEGARNDLLDNTTVFMEHQHSMLPVGKITDCILDNKGLLVEVTLSEAKFVDDIWTLIEEGILNSFSIGGVVLDGHDERSDDGRSYHIIDKILILEVSIVGLPANPEAKFSPVYKSFKSAIAEQIKQKEGRDEMAKQEKQEVTKSDESQEEIEKIEEPKNDEATSEKVSEETKEDKDKKEDTGEAKEEVEEERVEADEEQKEEKVEETTLDASEEEKKEREKLEDKKVEDSEESKEEIDDISSEYEEQFEEGKSETEEVVDNSEAIAEASEEAVSDVAKEEASSEIVEKSQETSLEKESEEVESGEEKSEETDEEKAEWTTAYINMLPNSSFAVIEPAYLDGKTEDKRARHLPFKDENGEVDLPHYRNALARVNQIKPITDSISTEELRKRAAAELEKYRDLLETEEEKSDKSVEEKILDTLAQILEKLSALDKKEIKEKEEETDSEKAEEKEDSKEKQEEYTCECLECGEVITISEHCRDIKCPKCGGEMRRQERPGVGKDAETKEEKEVEKKVETEEGKTEKKEEIPTRKSMAVIAPSPYEEEIENREKKSQEEIEREKNLKWAEIFFGKKIR